MFLWFGESPLKTENLIKRMDRPLLSFSAKIIVFVTHADLNSMTTNVAFRQSLLELEIYLWKCRENRIDFSLMIILLVTYRDYFYTNVTYMIFLSNKGLIQCWRQCTTMSSSVRYFCVKSISAWLTENYALFYNNTASIVLNHCLGRGRGKCSILSILSRLGLFLQFFFLGGGGGLGGGG